MPRRISLLICLLVISTAAFFTASWNWLAATAQPAKQPPAEIPAKTARWEYLKWTSSEGKLSFDLNKFGADGWELVVANPKNPGFDAVDRNSKYDLILKRPQRPMTNQETTLVGFWTLVKGDRQGISDLTLECTAYKTLIITGKAGGNFEIHGQYEVAGDTLLIQLQHGRATIESREKIKKLTATELVIEDEKGKVEEYKRANR